MLRGWVIVFALALIGGRAFAQSSLPVGPVAPPVRTGPIAVAATPSSTDANGSLLEFLGDEGFSIDAPTSFDPDPLLDWSELVPGDPELVVVLALEVRRVIVLVPGERRFLERVLPDGIRPSDAYPIALAATELLEIAGWEPPESREPVVEPGVELPPVVETPPPGPDDEDETVDDRDVAPARRAVRRFDVGVGASGWLAFPVELEALDLRLAFGITFPRGLGEGRWFASTSLSGLGHDTIRRVLEGYPTTAVYARRALGLRAGLAFRSGRWEARPFVAASLEWVHVTANQREAGVRIGQGTDDRLVPTFGLGLEGRLQLGSRVYVGAGLGFDALPARITYTGFGSAIFDEPPTRATVNMVVGATWPRGP